MKIGVMSDTHLSEVTPRLCKIVEESFRDTDLILHAGDIGSRQVLDYLEAHRVVAVRGNMDGTSVGKRLPIKKTIKADGYRIGLIHGWGAPAGLAQRLRTEFDRIDCLVFGHSHEPENRVFEGLFYFNPGSVSHPRGRDTGTIGLLHTDERIWGEIISIE